ncbi:S8 family serine peptidase [Planosporangium mesophilum]|uniref:Peptidase inhibitor I9 n=1 Tax=Planosporangium mesophilum TaxID=689768 RepID=A0A8J3TFF4_9ACTN|nr:S8 family serine peptidase [Planosporangium mesophilum]NJC82528.1 S8 family serine peptidase [Planosporangium mesophilum]GII25468.1 hypothetical protein Pme01_50650 [Planosporangium mesophilum]
MSLSSRAGRRRPAALAVATVAVTAFGLFTPGGAVATAAPAEPAALYLVQTQGASIAGYEGGVQNIPATKPEQGKKLDRHSSAYQTYRQYLLDQHKKVRQSAGVDHKTIAEYSTTWNGFAAKLTLTDVAKLKNTPGVVDVFRSKVHHVSTVSTPSFLGLDGPGGVWQKQFGDPAHAGEGVIVGVLDTGFWPENPSFAPLPEPRPDQAAIDAKWGTGATAAQKCQTGDTGPIKCNNKVIGARWFNAEGYGDANPGEFHSPRDHHGHGSHTASTAAGDNGVMAAVNGSNIGRISGMAPAARLAIYKVLYTTADGSGGQGGTVDIVAAIDQAVADGVDILSYSIGDDDDAIGPEDQAFFNAAAAGVFVSAAAGNNGAAGAATVDNASPWMTTVAASTHDRGYSKTVTLGNGASYTGAGLGTEAVSAPLLDSVNAGAAGQDATAVELCTPGTLDPVKVTGKIVLCKRGVVARVDKSKAVKEAGGVGMIQYNPSPNSLNADFHYVPSIHVDQTAGAAIKAYIAGTANPTASLSPATQVKNEAPEMAAFSSIGPSVSSSGDLLKPDITAPGVDVLAAVAPPSHNGQDFDLMSGTSMATPHISGIAALIIAKHPNWSPMAVKSAMMTTAYQLDNAGKPIQRDGADANPLDFGAGHVSPAPAFDPGLVYDSNPLDWIRYMCGVGVPFKVGPAPGWDVCPYIGKMDPSNLNYPSIAVGDLAGEQTITRTVTNVSGASTYTVKVQAPAGLSVTVSPSVIVVRPGQSVTYKVTIKRTGAAADAWAFGSLTWRDTRGHAVRSPIAVRPVDATAPKITRPGASAAFASEI